MHSFLHQSAHIAARFKFTHTNSLPVPQKVTNTEYNVMKADNLTLDYHSWHGIRLIFRVVPPSADLGNKTGNVHKT